MNIHYIYFDLGFGKTLEDYKYCDSYKENIAHNFKLNPNLKPKIWSKKMVEDIIPLQYLKDYFNELYNECPMMTVDFAKYLILLVEGGVYCDLDDKLSETLDLDKEGIIGYIVWKKKIQLNNNLIYFKDAKKYEELIQFHIERKRKLKMPKCWSCRRILYLGPKTLDIFCKNLKMCEIYKYATCSVLHTPVWLDIYSNRKVKEQIVENGVVKQVNCSKSILKNKSKVINF